MSMMLQKCHNLVCCDASIQGSHHAFTRNGAYNQIGKKDLTANKQF